jgi:hypothetical protein
LIEAIKNADFNSYNEINKRYQKVWLKRGIYLLMDRVRIILWRTLIKKMFQIIGPRIEMELI